MNGFGGVDFLDADADGYRRAGEALLETGVTAYLPTLITSPEEQLLAALREVPADGDYPRILGVHLEGPFLSPRRLGTHVASARRDPDLALLDRLLDGGPVRLMTLAPELPGADVLIERLLERGVTVSLGHSDATAEQANAAFDLGVAHRHAPLQRDAPVPAPRPGHRRRRARARRRRRPADPRRRPPRPRDGAASSGARRPGGSRSSPTRSPPPARATAPTRFGSLDVQVHDGAVRGPDGVLAGSVLTMIEAVRNLHALGVPLADAVDAATAVPARVLGLPRGSAASTSACRPTS